MLKKEYTHILFDLDRTLWDFDTNSRNNIYQLLDSYNLVNLDKTSFFQTYDKINHSLWSKYESGELPKEVLRWKRFHDTFLEFGIDNMKMSVDFAESYLDNMPNQTTLMPYAKEVLERLKSKGCRMSLVTNGFKEVQHRKIQNSAISSFFESVLISEEQGVHQPSPINLQRAINSIGGEKPTTLMVGDDFSNDIEGAMIFGIDQFFYNYKKIECEGGPTYESSDLRDLVNQDFPQ